MSLAKEEAQRRGGCWNSVGWTTNSWWYNQGT